MVASRGKDFSRDEHAEVVRHGVAENYLPTVDVFLPVCNEPIGIIANTWKYVSALDYPHVTVYVLDDGAKDSVRDLAQVFGFRCERRRSGRFWAYLVSGHALVVPGYRNPRLNGSYPGIFRGLITLEYWYYISAA